jgi:hypothetical protein
MAQVAISPKMKSECLISGAVGLTQSTSYVTLCGVAELFAIFPVCDMRDWKSVENRGGVATLPGPQFADPIKQKRRCQMPTAKERRTKEALASPASHFDSPSQITSTKSLTDEQKKKALDVWEEDARRLSVATEEGMSGGEPSRMDEVAEAKAELGIKDDRKPAPTKSG